MRRVETAIAGVCLIEPRVLRDERGYFFESYNRAAFAALGITDEFVQDNQALSGRGALRGLHYQIEQQQAKLCRVIAGEVLDVVVDVRRGSPTFGEHVSIILSAENMRQIYIPRGFAHGYLVLSETAEFVYKCSDFYAPEHERGVLWNDAQLDIKWDVKEPTLSAKDRAHLPLAEIAPADLPVYES